MSFYKKQPNPTFFAKVGICPPGADKPDFVLNVEYRYMNRKSVREYFGNLSGKTDVEALGEIIVGWRCPDVPEYSADSLADLLDEYPSSPAELFDKFRVELFEAKRKN